LFEGTSRRVENPTDPSLLDGKGAQKKAVQSPILPAASPMPSIDADLPRH
jgi:hypothetical protein